MKWKLAAGFAAIVVLGGLATYLVIAANSNKDQWKKVQEARDKGLPKTAIEALEPIIKKAREDGNHPEAIKAIATKIALEGNIQGNKPEEKITRLQAEIEKAPKEEVPVMDAILAHWYWHYFQQNRWRFLQRSATSVSPGNDITTWDLRRIFAEIDKQFTKALSAEKELKGIAIGTYDDLLEKGTMPDSYRPTLYDFIANEALTFYSSPEQAGSKAEDSFELAATSPIFAPVAEFMKWEPKTSDTESRIVKAIQLYQSLLRFHENDEDKSAFLDADLARLNLGYNSAFGEEKAARYKEALKLFGDKHAGHELFAKAKWHRASVLQGESELVEARKIALEGQKAYPESVGGKLCYNLVQSIEAKSSQVTAERVWTSPWPTVRVEYRNVTKVFFRAVPWDFTERLKSGQYRPEYLNDQERKALIARKPAKEWSADLPETSDYQQRSAEIAPPKDLKPGFYFLLASHEPNFGAGNSVVTFADFWVSDLALVLRTRQGENTVEGFVLKAESGEPIEGAKIQLWVRGQNARFAPGPKAVTDKNGLFSAQANAQNGFLVLASHDDQQLASANDFYLNRYDYRPLPHPQTVFFTDRSLYRPGQTIQYKGICIHVDQEGADYHVMPNHSLMVTFTDPNGKEIAKERATCNEYGSFSGSFMAPRDRVMGRMMIAADASAAGVVQFNVEEYKRPKFQVTLDAPKEAARLNAQVNLSGKAMAYTGASIGGGQVRFRVVREVRYPPWWGWCYGWWRQPKTESQEIAHGFAQTNLDGSFQVTFVAKPDVSVPETDEPVFHYTVSADVTDGTGETRSAQKTVNVGYTALQASLKADEWQTATPVKVTVRTETLDGEGQTAKTKLKVYTVKQPDKVHRSDLVGASYNRPIARKGGKLPEPNPNSSDPNAWPLGDEVAAQDVTTNDKGEAIASFKLGAGLYRAMLETQDRFGKAVTARLPLQVLQPDANALNIKVPNVVASPKWSLEPGEEFTALWGTGYDKGRAFVEIELRNQVKKAFWTDPGRTQVEVKQAVTEAMRGGFTLRVTMVRENRAYLTQRQVQVPWTNKQLTVKWERFVSKLEPAKKETFTAVVTGPDAKRAVAEMVATLYDESLDAYLPHHWMERFGVFRQEYSRLGSNFENMGRWLQHLQGQWPQHYKDVQIVYRHLPNDLTVNLWGYAFLGGEGGRMGLASSAIAPGAPRAAWRSNGITDLRDAEQANAAIDGLAKRADKPGGGADPNNPPPPPGPDLSQVTARKNLNETAFFFPKLVSDSEGVVKLEFTMPEALTQWKFMGFAHDKQLRSGFLQDKVVTAKDLMAQPNPPRFVREGDAIEFTVKVSNQSDKPQKGNARLTLADARTGQNVDKLLGNGGTDRSFDIPAKESRTLSWRLQVPDGMGPLTYKAVAATDSLSDGEEGGLPVLSRRVLVTESLPLPIRGPGEKSFDFTKLRQSAGSDTLQSQSLTVQMVSNPSWYAVMALPYLMEYPYECSEQIFNRFYANGLARHIANSDPKIRRVFDQWKGTTALDSPLEKNQDLKSVTLEETPWLRQAMAESQARKNVGILFDDNRLNAETAANFMKLAQMQLPDGAWPWFPGGMANDYITLYITTGFGRMRNLGVQVDIAPAVRSLARLDGWVNEMYQNILRHSEPEKNHLNPLIAFYLYGRSFFLKDKPIDDANKKAIDYWLGQAKKYWLQLANRQSQAHLAVALNRFRDRETALAIMKSMKERSVTNEEMGMFWRDLELSFFWFRAPIETQAMMIEAFSEVMNDAQAVEECKVWLLKQKQTQDWKTTKATADACYALLLRGENLLRSDLLVEVGLGGIKIQPEKVEAGTGFYEQRFVKIEVKPTLAAIHVKKLDEGVAWGSVHWQYLEDVAKVTPHEGTPLKLKKTLWTRQLTKKGPVLEPLNGPAKVGDELVVRVELRTDRDMEYVHLKDARGSGTEPVNVLSRYKYQDGLAYYESTRDTATHFFIDYLPKGVYVFEYTVRVQHRGQYQTGMAEIQCMYAPEFNSHSESVAMEVK